MSKPDSQERAGPMAGIRVIEWGANYTVPLAGMILADQGADVIKVEPPTGDGTRYASANRQGVSGLSASFLTANRNKRSIALDLKQPSAVQALRDLICGADVVMQNFRPGVVESYGLGYDDLKALNPGLVYVSVSGFGRMGPYSKQRVWDPVVQAVSGMMASQGDPGGAPATIKTSIADKVTALYVAQAVSAALFARQRGNPGQHVEIDMLGAALAFSSVDSLFNHMWEGDDVDLGVDLRNLRVTYETQDGKYICASAISDKEWVALTDAVGLPHLVDDPRFKDSFSRLKNSIAMAEELCPAFRTRKASEWLDILRARDTVCAPVNSERDLFDDPQIRAAGLIVTADHPQAGRYRQAAHPISFGATPAAIKTLPPTLGADGEDILRKAGRDGEDIAKLRQDGALR
ncbi:MAG: CoA transferase [Novosphingobium sp.]